jgi:hypothetical protein
VIGEAYVLPLGAARRDVATLFVPKSTLSPR